MGPPEDTARRGGPPRLRRQGLEISARRWFHRFYRLEPLDHSLCRISLYLYACPCPTRIDIWVSFQKRASGKVGVRADCLARVYASVADYRGLRGAR